jgi:APA family basic amino acid/polyamine antiporter
VARGISEFGEMDADVPPQGVAPLPGIPTPGGKQA